MSSIFGKFHRNDKPIEQRDLLAMQNRLDHWEADDRQIWLRDQIGLGHLLLYNTPQSVKESQPFQARFIDITITANARLDNRDELFVKLSVPGHLRHSIPDCRLILKAYLKWGEKCVEHLIGAFAFAIWDKSAQKLFCARDQMGIRPFYYYCTAGVFAFASEIKGLLVLPQVTRAANQSYVLNTLCSLPVRMEQTAFSQISKLPPAHTLTVGKKHLAIRKYWELSPEPDREVSTRDIVEVLRHKIETAVADRLRTIHPVGSQLSHNLNSTTITAVASKYLQKRNLAFSAYTHTMPDEGLGKIYPFVDERQEVNRFTGSTGVRNVRFVTGMETGKTYLEDAYRNGMVTDQFRDLNGGLPMHHMSKVAADHRVKTLLSGFPGNDLFLSPDRHLSGLPGHPPGQFHWQKAPFAFWRVLRSYFPMALKYLQAVARREPLPLHLYWPQGTSLLHPRYMKQLPGLKSRIFEATFAHNRSRSAKDQQRWLLTQNPLCAQRFEQETHSALSHRVDIRYPFADIRLIEFCHALPDARRGYPLSVNSLMREAVLPLFPADYIPSDFPVGRAGIFPGLLYKLYTDLPAVEHFLQEHRRNSLFNFINFEKIEQYCRNLENANRNPGSRLFFPYETLNSIIKMLLHGKRYETPLLQL